MQNIKTVVVAKGLIFNEGRVLVLKRMDGILDLPGGKLEEGEGYREGLKREIWEETGLVNFVISGSYVSLSFPKRAGFCVVGVTLLCWYLGGQVNLSPEHCCFMWVSLTQLRSMEIYWKYGLDRFGFDFIKQSSERGKAYGGLEYRGTATRDRKRIWRRSSGVGRNCPS